MSAEEFDTDESRHGVRLMSRSKLASGTTDTSHSVSLCCVSGDSGGLSASIGAHTDDSAFSSTSQFSVGSGFCTGLDFRQRAFISDALDEFALHDESQKDILF